MHNPLSKHDLDMIITFGIGGCGILLLSLIATGVFGVLGMCGIAIATTAVLVSSVR